MAWQERDWAKEKPRPAEPGRWVFLPEKPGDGKELSWAELVMVARDKYAAMVAARTPDTMDDLGHAVQILHNLTVCARNAHLLDGGDPAEWTPRVTTDLDPPGGDDDDDD